MKPRRAQPPATQAIDLPSVHELSGRLVAAFEARGYTRFALPILQPADVFLDVLGEKAAANAFVFPGPEGETQCLRTDLTVPLCRAYLETHADARGEAKVCSSGLVFRALDEKGGKLPSQEFRQAGLEWFGDRDAESADAEIVAIVLTSLRDVGLAKFKLNVGDVGLFRAIIGALGIPERWRWRILDYFAKEKPFGPLLEKFSKPDRAPRTPAVSALIAGLDPEDADGARERVARVLEEEGAPLIGSRTLDEIAGRLLDLAADERAAPLSPAAIRLIMDYKSIRAPLEAAGARISELAAHLGAPVQEALDVYKRRLAVLKRLGVDTGGAVFEAQHGRGFEYYSGFVFDVEAEGEGPANRIAGGGRYDGLMKAVGAADDVPAVGAAVYIERLQNAVQWQAQ